MFLRYTIKWNRFLLLLIVGYTMAEPTEAPSMASTVPEQLLVHQPVLAAEGGNSPPPVAEQPGAPSIRWGHMEVDPTPQEPPEQLGAAEHAPVHDQEHDAPEHDDHPMEPAEEEGEHAEPEAQSAAAAEQAQEPPAAQPDQFPPTQQYMTGTIKEE